MTHADVSMMHVSMMHVSMMHVSMMHDAWNGSCVYDAKLFGNGGTNGEGDSRRCIYIQDACMRDAYIYAP